MCYGHVDETELGDWWGAWSTGGLRAWCVPLQARQQQHKLGRSAKPARSAPMISVFEKEAHKPHDYLAHDHQCRAVMWYCRLGTYMEYVQEHLYKGPTKDSLGQYKIRLMPHFALLKLTIAAIPWPPMPPCALHALHASLDIGGVGRWWHWTQWPWCTGPHTMVPRPPYHGAQAPIRPTCYGAQAPIPWCPEHRGNWTGGIERRHMMLQVLRVCGYWRYCRWQGSAHQA